MAIFRKAVLFLMLIVKMVYSENRLISIDEEDNIGSCTRTAHIFWKFTWQHFKDRYGVIIGDFNNGFPDLSTEILQCGMRHNQLPIRYVRRGWNETVKPTEHTAIFQNRVVDGFIFITDSAEIFKSNMHKIKKLDQNAETVLILAEATTEDVVDILKTLWSERHALNLVVFRIIERTNSADLLLSIYDPFIIKNDTRGFVYTFHMEDDDILMKSLLGILEKRLINVHGYPLKVCIYEFRGVVAPDEYDYHGSVTKYKLTDGEIIDAIVRTINFKPVYYSPPDGQQFGQKLPNGTLTGSFLEIDSGKADILANKRSVRDYGTKNSEFLFIIEESKYAFIVPNMHSMAVISFMEIFTPGVSIALAGAYVTVVIVWCHMQKFHHQWKSNDGRKTDLVKICYVTFGNFLLISQRCGFRDYERCLFTGWIFFSTITCLTYQATMVEHLTTSFKSLDIQSLEQLADSDLTIFIGGSYKGIMKVMSDNEGGRGAFTRILEHSDIYFNGTGIVQRVAFERDAAMLTTMLGCRIYQQQMYSNRTGKSLLHVLEEGPPTGYSAHMVPLYSPFKTRFNQVLMRIAMSGLMPKWSDDVLCDLKRKSAMRSKIYSTSGLYTMKELSFIFYSWFGCTCFCCTVFLLELLSASFFMKNVKKKMKLLRKR